VHIVSKYRLQCLQISSLDIHRQTNSWTSQIADKEFIEIVEKLHYSIG